MMWITELGDKDVADSKIRMFDKLDTNNVKYDYIDCFDDLHLAVIKNCSARVDEIADVLDIRMEDIRMDSEHSLILIRI